MMIALKHKGIIRSYSTLKRAMQKGNLLHESRRSPDGLTKADKKAECPEKRKAAIDFLTWLGTPEAQKLWIEGYKLTVSFAGADVSALPPAYSDLIDSIAAQGSYPWLFSMYPSVVFEEACKNGAQQYMLKRTTANDVIKNIDATWKAAK
jgi:ABC-type glycerol-3-phosphate transport system substrate-binding protein